MQKLPRATDPAETDLFDPHRPALPPGHVVSWSALLAGTSLEGEEWPGWPNPDLPPPLAAGGR